MTGESPDDLPARNLPDSTRVEPGSGLRPGRTDAVIVLLLWAGRRAFLPLLLLGMVAAVAAGRFDEDTLVGLSRPADLVGALLSPLAGIAGAVLLRFAVGWAALAAAWPLSRWPHRKPRGSWSQPHRDVIDRWRLAQAYRSLRWTWGVRDEAIARAGRLGRWLGWAVPGSTVATVVAVVAFVVVVGLRPPSA
jgi:hypothetical protein